MKRVVALELSAQGRSFTYTLELIALELSKIRQKFIDDELLVVLPENFLGYPQDEKEVEAHAKGIKKFNIIEKFAQLSRKYNLYLVAGTIVQKLSNKYFITSIVFYNGKIIGAYQKNHLFKAQLPTKAFDEGKYFTPGDKLCIIDTTFGRIAIGICFDIRFAKMFVELKKHKVDIICLPAAFSYLTGVKHWEILLRARAIENQAYIIGCGLNGLSSNGVRCFGNSMIIDPDGCILAEQKNNYPISYIDAPIDLAFISKIRKLLPLD